MAEPNWWENDPVVGQAPATMPNPQMPVQRGPVYGPAPAGPDPVQLENLRINQMQEQRAQEKFQQEQQAEAEKAEMTQMTEKAARDKLIRVIGTMNKVALDANDNSGWGETGTTGRMGRAVPIIQTAGKDLAANIDTLRANYAFDALQAMRDASKTGGALGQVSEIELQLLERAVANVDPNQTHEQFLANIENARQAYLSKLAFLQPELAQRMGYDPAKAEAAWVALNDRYNQEFGLQNPEPQFERKVQTDDGWTIERVD